MTIKTTIAALALLVSGSLVGTAAIAGPITPTHGISSTQKLTQPVHYRAYRHCHRRYRRCHGGYAYYGGPSIYLGFGGRRHHHYRGFRGGGRHIMHRGGRGHH